MVKKTFSKLVLVIPCFISFFLFSISAQSENTQENEIILNQKLVAELALKRSYKTKQTNLLHQTYKLVVIQNRALFDWILGVDTGYQFDNSNSLLNSGTSPLNNKFEQYKTIVVLNKPFKSGTLLGLEYSRISQQSHLDPIFTNPPPDKQTLDNIGFTFEQSLLANSFGEADKSISNATDLNFQAQSILRANNLEDIVLESIRQFWTTFTAQENFKQAITSRDRYKQLVNAVKRKTSFGYSNPGDLPQAQAELEAREQAVKSTSTIYLNNLSNLITLLDLNPNSEVKFDVDSEIPVIPKLQEKNIDELRSIKSQKFKVEAALENLIASKSKSFPTLNLVGKLYSSGWGESSQESYSGMITSDRPKYYAGIKLNYHFGSDVQNEDLINKKIIKDLEETNLKFQSLTAKDSLSSAERKVQEAYSFALSAKKQKDFREKAVIEMNRSYAQGRTDISILINSMNTYVSAELSYIQAVGNYNVALNEWAAVRDELIPDAPQTEEF